MTSGRCSAFYNDPVSKHLRPRTSPRAESGGEIALILGHCQMRGFGPWALEDKASEHFVGLAGLWFPEGWDDVEIGYGLAPGTFRRKGYAAEAAGEPSTTAT